MKKIILFTFLCFSLTYSYSLPVIGTQPLNKTICEGNTVDLTVAATGSGTLTYKWQVKYVTGNYTDLNAEVTEFYSLEFSGETTNKLVIKNINFGLNETKFQCVVTDENGSTNSNSAQFSIKSLPGIDTSSVLKACDVNTISIKTNTLYDAIELSNCRYELFSGATLITTVDDNNPVTVESKFPIKVTSFGQYFFKTTRSDNSCYRTDTLDIIKDCGSVISIVESNKITASVFPNPFANNFLLDFSIDKPSVVKIDITNIIGEKVYGINLGMLQAGNQNKQINTENLIDGIYFIKITADNHTKVVKAICKK